MSITFSMDWLLQSVKRGFSLAELLISLALVGVLAAFTVPVLFNTPNSSLDKKQTAMTRDVAYMILAAFEQYKASHPDISTMRASDLTPYMNYVAAQTSSTIDDLYGYDSMTCSASMPCYKLHNGGILHHWTDGFCNGSPTAIPYDFAPTSTYSGTTNSPYKAIRLWLYSDGSIRASSNMKANTVWTGLPGQTCDHVRSSDPDPPWFNGF